jgi:hypothetical protein
MIYEPAEKGNRVVQSSSKQAEKLQGRRAGMFIFFQVMFARAACRRRTARPVRRRQTGPGRRTLPLKVKFSRHFFYLHPHIAIPTL